MMNTKTAFSLAAAAALTAGSAQASIVLYSTDFTIGTGLLNGKVVDTSGATTAQHAQYGTTENEAWTAGSLFQADGTYDGVSNSSTTRLSATLSFTPQNGYVYELSYTSNFANGTNGNGWHAGGFFAANNYTANVLADGAGSVWGLTGTNQTLFLDLNGGNNDRVGTNVIVNGSTTPTTLTFILDTTGGTGDWSAEWFVNGTSHRTVADLNAVQIKSVGIGALYFEAGTAAFQSFELSVIPEPSSTMLIGLGGLMLALRRRHSC